MKVLFAVILVACACGCSRQENVVSDDNKPVAPETYQDGKSEKTDPQLPPMVPHWKEAK